MLLSLDHSSWGPESLAQTRRDTSFGAHDAEERNYFRLCRAQQPSQPWNVPTILLHWEIEQMDTLILACVRWTSPGIPTLLSLKDA